MKLRKVLVVLCLGLGGISSVYAQDKTDAAANNLNNPVASSESVDQSAASQIADSANIESDVAENPTTTGPMLADNSPYTSTPNNDTLTSNPDANENMGVVDPSQQSAMNNTDAGLSPDTATGDDDF